MARTQRPLWVARETILLVGEGADEEAFLKHIKNLAQVRGTDRAYKVQSATGGSPLDVLDWTLKQTQIAHYDEVHILLDNDTIVSGGYELAIQRYKEVHEFEILISRECLEDLLLRAARAKGNRSRSLKWRLESLLGTNSATDPSSYVDKFGISVLNRARKTEVTIDELLIIFRI
jgi:hypothetical protein